MSDRVLLTGATGLIGTWVVRQWPAGPTLVPVGSRDVDLLRPGAADALVADVEPTHVVHLAWSASGQPGYRHSPDNSRWVSATRELAVAAHALGAQLWLTGTIVDLVDTDPTALADPYTASKAALRRAFSTDIKESRVGWLRPGYVVDETLGRPALVAEAQAAARAGAPVSLRSPNASHDFVHAADVGAAIVLAVTQGLQGELPIGSGRLRPVTELVKAVGAQWRHQSRTGTGVDAASTHAETACDIGWLAARGWRPLRTEALFSGPAGIDAGGRGEP